jgi:hypothetical protein
MINEWDHAAIHLGAIDALGKVATHGMLKTTQVTKTAHILPFLYCATVFGQTLPIFVIHCANLNLP